MAVSTGRLDQSNNEKRVAPERRHPKFNIPNVSLYEEFKAARKMSSVDLRDHVKTGGPWDFKEADIEKYETFGNFNFGFVGGANGLPGPLLLWGAGRAQTDDDLKAGVSNPYARGNAATSPWGDDPADQVAIQLGIEFSLAYSQNTELPYD